MLEKQLVLSLAGFGDTTAVVRGLEVQGIPLRASSESVRQVGDATAGR